MSSSQTQSSGASTYPGYLISFPVAMACSWLINHSVMWALLHGLGGWWYLLWLCLGCGGGFDGVESAIGKQFYPEKAQISEPAISEPITLPTIDTQELVVEELTQQELEAINDKILSKD